MSRSLYARLSQRFEPERVLLSRRALLRSAALFAASGVLASLSRAALPQPAGAADKAASKGKKVIIIGAGFAGLSCALELVARGHDVSIHEGRGRVGGRVSTMRDLTENSAVEAGGEWIGANHPTWLALAKRFSLELAEAPDDEKLYSPLYLHGELLGEESTKQLHEEMTKVFDSMNQDAKDLDCEAPWNTPNARELDRLTVAQWLAAQNCSDLCRSAIRAQLTNDNGMPIAWQSYLGHLAMVKGGGLQDYWEQSETFRCRQGNQELANRIYMTLGADRFMLANPITRIEVGDSSVLVTDGRGRKHQADTAVLATAPSVWKKIEFVPSLPPALAVQMGSATKMLCTMKSPAWKALGLTAESMTDTDIGYTWESTGVSPNAKNAVLAAFAGGPGTEFGLRMNEPERNEQYNNILNKIYKGIDSDVESMRFVGWPNDQWTLGGYSFPAPGQVVETCKALREGIGRLQFAGEHVSTAFPGYMEGALSSGMAAAHRVDASYAH